MIGSKKTQSTEVSGVGDVADPAVGLAAARSDHPAISRALDEILSEMTNEAGFSSFTSHSSAVQD